MKKFNVFIVVLYTFTPVKSIEIVRPGPKYKPTYGEVWPTPAYIHIHDEELYYNPKKFQYVSETKNCTLLNSAIERNQQLLDNLYELVNRSGLENLRRELFLSTNLSEHIKLKGTISDIYLKELKISMRLPCDEKMIPDEEMDESYSLVIAEGGQLQSNSIWGAMRGLETFSQLFFIPEDKLGLRIHLVVIRDAPAYPHRGLMLDTSRHFISMANILRIIEAMECNKMNVFHWHLTDDASFPLEMFSNDPNEIPYHPKARYSNDDISKVVSYALERGIRVVPEISVPTHANTWAAVSPGVLTLCQDGSFGPMNPLYDGTYQLIESVYVGILSQFPEGYVHIGFRNINFSCWKEDDDFNDFMEKNNIKKKEDLLALFLGKVLDMFNVEKTIMLYQEIAEYKIYAGPKTVLQVWKNNDIESSLCQGHRVVFSSCWQLDHDDWVDGGWEDFYNCDPRSKVEDMKDSIIGGEAFVRTEFIDDSNVMTRIWPRASAVAERLWTNPAVNATLPYNRIEEHACRMIRRGIPVQPPNGPGFCFH